MVRVTYKFREPGTDRPFKVVGTGATRAAAVAEAKAKAAMTCGDYDGGTISDALLVAEGGEPNAGAQFSDANLSLRNAGGQVVNIFLENIATDLGTGNNGLLDLENELIVAFATVYRDGQGNGGYVPYDGHFVS